MANTFTQRYGPLSFKLTALLYATTFVHHIYGGVAFRSTERTVLAVVFSVLFLITYLIYRRASVRRWAATAYWLLVYGFWVGLLGLFEGFYNHTLFVVLRASGYAGLDRLYGAASDARISDDLLFQATGVLTFVFAVVLGLTPLLARKRIQLMRDVRQDLAG